METNTISAPEHYNPNQLVTYKVIGDNETTYPTAKVVDIEYSLHLGRTSAKAITELKSKIRQLEENLTEYIDSDSETIIADICEIFGFNPTREIEFEATARITGTVSVPLSQLADFDINDIYLTAYPESHTHEIYADVEIEDIFRTN